MANWSPNKNQQWGGEQAYQPVYQPGPPSDYAPAGPSYPLQQQENMSYVSDQKDPYEGGRFAPKNRIHDPIFLVFFIAQVSDASQAACDLS